MVKSARIELKNSQSIGGVRELPGRLPFAYDQPKNGIRGHRKRAPLPFAPNAAR
jgi:hypothetical protein